MEVGSSGLAFCESHLGIEDYVFAESATTDCLEGA